MPAPRRLLITAAVCGATALALSACTSSGDSGSSAGGSGPAASAASSATLAAGDGCSLQQTGYPKIDLKTAKIGFSQSEPESAPFRVAETQSIKDEAAKLGIPSGNLITTNANSQLSKQIADIQDMLAQGVQALIVAPLNSDGLEPALAAAKAKKVPVVTIDRKVTSPVCSDYLTFIGSNFVDQGKRAADALITATGGTDKVAILLGSSGNNGFVDEIKAKASGITIVAQQTGDFARDKGQQVMEQLIQANPDITAVYAENDEMGLGAMTALQTAGKNPGKDVKIVSVDGTRNAVQAIVAGTYNAVIESNPRFGPLAFQTLQNFEDGQAIPADIIITDSSYDSTNAASKVNDAF
jgi:ABC-type sugar transport system substrate-binding protein